MLPNYCSLKEQVNMPESQEARTLLHLCKQLLATAEACEVRSKIFLNDLLNKELIEC